MPKSRSGSIRVRPSSFHAQVNYLDEEGRRQKIELKAATSNEARSLLKRTAQELERRDGVSITAQRLRKRRGGIFARVTFIDDRGKRREIERLATNRSDAKELIKDMLRDLDDHGENLLDAANMSFRQLAEHFEKNYLTEPEYVDGRKVAGLRSYYGLRIRLGMLKEYFGKHKVRGITHGDIKRFKADRLRTLTHVGFVARVAFTDGRAKTREMRRKVKSQQQAEAVIQQMIEKLGQRKRVSIGEQVIEARSGKQRSITTVNRELGLLRRVFNVALSNGWMRENPFAKGDALITPGDEKRRERILTREEEARLLAACTDRREHLRPIIICALDTGMRKGEILKLVPSDLDFENRVVSVRAFNTKTMRERKVAMTERLANELAVLIETLSGPDALLFGIRNDFKKAFVSAREVAGLSDVRFHDLRHTHATRLVAAHVPLSEVGRALGHTQANTTFRYVNANIETARRVAAVLDDFNNSVGHVETQTIK
jgi:integrase